MASAPSDPKPVLGRVDGEGRLIAADPELERLQVEAGSELGAALALPQLAAVARVAQRLRIPVARRVTAAGRDQDVDMWVRAVPEGEEVALTIDGWTDRPASPRRLPEIPETADPQPLVDSTIHSALRSPLDSIVQCAEEMIERADGPARDAYAVYAADIAAAARHLLSVIRSLEGQAEVPAGHQVDLADLASEAIALVEAAANEREIVIAVQPLRSLMARGEPQGVIQILVNLIGNAVRYSAERSAVTVSFETVKGSVMVHVADEGSGIEPADQERIFEPFQRGKGGDGSGLGLSISRRLARRMGGDIQLESIPGEGSLFTLVLPAA